MDKLGEAISEIHLYENKVESLIKVGIYSISWIGGILGIKNSEVLGNAYFIYMLSLLMDFVPKIYMKTRLCSRVLHTVLCLILLLVCLLSMSILLGVVLPDFGYTVMSKLTLAVMIYMWIDLLVLWMEPEKNLGNVENKGKSNSESQEYIFFERLSDGNLGDINKGEESNE